MNISNKNWDSAKSIGIVSQQLVKVDNSSNSINNSINVIMNELVTIYIHDEFKPIGLDKSLFSDKFMCYLNY